MARETFEQFMARVKASTFILGDIPMAKQVKLGKGKEFSFKTTKSGGESKYDWDGWLNGDLLLLEQSEGDKDDKGTVINITVKKDYEVDTNAMPPKLKVAARKRYKVVQISRLDADGHKLKNALIIKARDMDANERDAEDVQREIDKENLAQRKAGKATSDNGATGTPTASVTV